MTSYTTSPDPIAAQKAELRRQARRIRNAIPPAQRAADAEHVAKVGLPLPDLAPQNAGGYYPTRSEFDCRPLMQALVRAGWTLCLPVIVGEAPLQFRQWDFGGPVAVGERGIAQPVSGEHIRPSLLLVPLLAFDAGGFRLGYGGGHYDRTLEALRHDGPVIAVGLAFDAQEMAQIPAGPHDQRLDWILTPSGARCFRDMG